MTTESDFSRTFAGAGLKLPRILTLSITDCCNLACRHCFVDAGSQCRHGNVDAAILHRLIREFARLGGSGVRITGGEPLCHPAWLNLMCACRENNFERILLQTNGMLFTDADAAELHEFDFPGLSIQISIDGASAKSHDLIRGNGSCEGAVAGIKRLVCAGLGDRITLFFTEMRHNLLEFPELLKLAETYSIRSVTAGALVLSGRAREDSTVRPPDLEQYLTLLDRFDADPEFRERYGRIGSAAFLQWNGNSVRTESCTFAENPYLTPDGTLYPCVLCHAVNYSVQGVFEKGLTAAFREGIPVWSGIEKISEERSAALGECINCPGRDACKGGCMGRAWAGCGELNAPDDRCEVRKSIYTRALLRNNRQ